MFSSLSKFKLIPSTSTPLFSNPNVDYFPSDTIADSETHVGSSSELMMPSDIPSTSSDDVFSVDPAPPTVELPPRSNKEAFVDPHWQQAMHEELHALEKTHTWDLVDPL
ncbi:hypothetical protein L195_g058957 [Trifolium pratense]|uniref:Uncharacterized protein n=1 Tax=Trifolium pratense TaxID=57577 RepID=A0A2K3JV87_TRIPR|nr:hypothetical protein L195_g058957 [Trifolium pratense]